MNNIYFNFVSIGGGLADTLYKIDALYGLGEFLGFKYAFSPLQAKRSSDSILNDLGINNGLQNSTDVTSNIKRNCKQIELKLPNEIIIKSQSIDEIKDFVFANLKPNNSQDYYLSINSFHQKKRAMWHLRILLRKAGLSKIFLREKINIIDNYNHVISQKINTKKKLELSKKIKIFIHIRRGDTYCFKLSDGRLVSSWGHFQKFSNKPNQPNQPILVDSVQECPYIQIDNQSYLDIIIGLINEFGAEKLDITIASDGYYRGIERILQFSEELQLNQEQITEVRNLTNILEQQFINDFRNYANKLLIGESQNQLLETINEIVTSDVILSPIGGFVAAIHEYFSPIEKQKLIILGNKIPFYLSQIEHCQHKFFLWNPKQQDYLEILNWLIQEIKKTQKIEKEGLVFKTKP